MNDEDRRSLLRQLTDSEYRDVLSVCAMMPNVEITAHCEGPFLLLCVLHAAEAVVFTCISFAAEAVVFTCISFAAEAVVFTCISFAAEAVVFT